MTLLVGENNAGRVLWVELHGLALDAATEPPREEPAGVFRARLGLTGEPLALDRHALRALWASEDPIEASRALNRMLRQWDR